MRLFELRRTEDESGVSGTGTVAQGVIFDNGWCALTWLTEHTSVAFYTSVEEVIKIHGHGGKTLAVQIADCDAASVQNALKEWTTTGAVRQLTRLFATTDLASAGHTEAPNDPRKLSSVQEVSVPCLKCGTDDADAFDCAVDDFCSKCEEEIEEDYQQNKGNVTITHLQYWYLYVLPTALASIDDAVDHLQRTLELVPEETAAKLHECIHSLQERKNECRPKMG